MSKGESQQTSYFGFQQAVTGAKRKKSVDILLWTPVFHVNAVKSKMITRNLSSVVNISF